MGVTPAVGRRSLLALVLASVLVLSGCSGFAGFDENSPVAPDTPSTETTPRTTAQSVTDAGTEAAETASATATPTTDASTATATDTRDWYEQALPAATDLTADYSQVTTQHGTNESSRYAFREYRYAGGASGIYPATMTVYARQFQSADAARDEVDSIHRNTRRQYGVSGQAVALGTNRTGTQFVTQTSDGVYFTVTTTRVDASVVLVLGEDSDSYQTTVLTETTEQTALGLVS
mgnify:CR=1 FL=1